MDSMTEGDPFWYSGQRVEFVRRGRTGHARVRFVDDGDRERTVLAAKLRFRRDFIAEVVPPKQVVSVGESSRKSHQPVPKSSPVRSREYMDFVKEHPCCVCSSSPPSDPHHFGPAGTKGMGLKTDDLRTVPLCRGCHDQFHNKAKVGAMSKNATALHFYKVQVGLLVRWFAERKNA